MLMRYLGRCLFGLTIAANTAFADDVSCHGAVVWQVLGSGGPELNQRAQSGHVLWLDDKARAIFDTGSGTAAAFGRSHGHVEDLDVIALTHLHTDHSVDLPAYIMASFFGDRSRDLPIFGPPAGNGFPSLNDWLAALFSGEHAAYPYLAGFMIPSGASYRIVPTTVNLREGEIATVFKNDRLTIKAIRVVHGPVPAVAWRVEAGGRSVVYLGDTDARAPALVAFAKDADLLVVNLAIAEDTTDPVATALHAPPSRLATLAMRAGVHRLLLSHLMERSERAMPASLRIIASIYKGSVDVAHDGECIALRADRTPNGSL
jgi:ribonuclease BN (tRNA processing enzyme)